MSEEEREKHLIKYFELLFKEILSYLKEESLLNGFNPEKEEARKKTFDEWYDENVTLAYKRLPKASATSPSKIYFPINIQGFDPNFPIDRLPLYQISFVKMRNRKGQYYWEKD